MHIATTNGMNVRNQCARLPFFSRSGSMLLEAILSIAIFALFLSGIGLSMLVGQQSTISGADRVRGVFLAEEALEGVRQLRDQDFTSLQPGIYGISVGSDGRWALTAAPTQVDEYQLTLEIVDRGTDTLEATSDVRWDFGKARSGSVMLTTYLTNWKAVAQTGNWSGLQKVASWSGALAPLFTDIVTYGNYAFVSGMDTSGGQGLYVFDVTNPAAPQRIASAFTLGASVYDMTLNGSMLLLATSDATKEVQVYNISSPTTLSPASLSGSYDLPGAGLARSIDFFGYSAYVGTAENLSDAEFFSLDLSETGSLSLLDSLEISGTVSDISLHEGYAYLAASTNASELLVADVFDPENLAFAPGTGLDLPDTFDGLTTHTFGTSAVLGRANGTAINELTLYSIAEAPVPVFPPGPWPAEIGGDVLAMDSDPIGAYIFVASSTDTGELRVYDAAKFSSGADPLLTIFNAPNTLLGLHYDWVHDRLLAVTSTTLFIFAPST